MSLQADACKQCVRNDLPLRLFPVFKHYYSQPLTSINLQLNVIVSGVDSQQKKKKKKSLCRCTFFHLFYFFHPRGGRALTRTRTLCPPCTPPPSPLPLRSSIKHTAASRCQFFMQRCEVIALERPGSCPSSLPLSFYLFADAKSVTLSICCHFFHPIIYFYSSAWRKIFDSYVSFFVSLSRQMASTNYY